MGEPTQPADDPVEPPPDLPIADAPTVHEGPPSVRVVVEPIVAAPARPLAKLVVLAVLLAMLLVANDRSSASRERSLRTADPAQYVEPTTSTIEALQPTIVSTVEVPTTAGPLPTQPTEAPQAVHPAPTVPAATTLDTAPPQATADTATAAAVPPGGDGSGGSGSGADADVSRVIPDPAPPTGAAVVSPWADKTRTTAAGYVATDVGCAGGTSAGALDAFFKERIGPVIGHDYQHVYPLGGDRYLWLFQDTFVDYSGKATNLSQAVFDHNTAMIQEGACFTLYHRGSISQPTSFEQGNGENWKSKWFWPMGGQTVGGRTYIYWAQMSKDGYNPTGANGLGWHPAQTWLAVYDADTLQRLSFQPAANPGVSPIYGYAVASDGEYTYLFGNTFEQNLQREGGYFNGPHSGTRMWLARIPLGHFEAAPEYRSGDTWTSDESQATPIVERYWAENPMEPRYMNGQWVAATKIDGYWGDSLSIDVANDPWGPWTTVDRRGISPRGGDPLMNTYNAYLMPWLSGGSLVVSVSENARNMLRDAWPRPSRYRLMFFGEALVAPPPRDDTTTTSSVDDTTTSVLDTTTSVAETTTTTSETSTTVVDTTSTVEVTVPPETTTTSTVPPSTTTTTSSTPPPTTTSTTAPPAPITTVPPCTTDPSTTTTTTTTTVPPPTDSTDPPC
ncbi:MAG: hypothetical protein JWN62_4681 [Acidimicrobiales bacterium]|nr:hypothetical protein [Acidimicrobiales bacterium]